MSERGERRFERSIQRIGHDTAIFRDLYAFLLTARWATVVGLSALLYLGLNALFALAYWLAPGSVEGSDGSYLSSFFFSVQTFASIGYGAMYSKSVWSNSVVVVEAFASVFCIATLTGIVFAKFSRPKARVLFSDALIIETRDGVPTLSFRVANERGNDVVEASIRVSVLKNVLTSEGHFMRRFYDLPLERDRTPIFMLSWQIFHPIDERSPIHGMTPEQMVDGDVRFLVSLTGLDGTFSQTIHARRLYWADEVRAGHRFVDVIEVLEGGISRMDFRKFHDIAPEPKQES